jgi:dihydrofolate synthase / folylpolyglutamate synthase
MRFGDAVADLDGRQPGRMVPDLDRIRALADLLDHPERTYPSVHVTGTNGKTTTARVIARILCAHGLSTGVYTSPHFASITERVSLCDDHIPEAEFAEAYEHLRPYLDEVDRLGQERVTYFETLTALAYLWFADKPVDAAVFEVGMGGTWDATNLIPARVAVLCSIALDHPELGPTVRDVATEKAGIIKEGATAVIQEPGPDALPAIEGRARDVGATLILRGREYSLVERTPAVGGQRITVAGLHAAYEGYVLPLHGAHQAENAATAIVAAEAFLARALSEEALREALDGLTAPGRLEVVARHPLVVLDGAHNPEAARALATALPEAFTWERLHLVVGVLDTKDVDGILTPLVPASTRGYACANQNPKSVSPDRLADACRAAGIADVEVYPSVASALDAAHAAAEENDLILVTGSLYTVADARPRYVRSEGSHGS